MLPATLNWAVGLPFLDKHQLCDVANNGNITQLLIWREALNIEAQFKTTWFILSFLSAASNTTSLLSPSFTTQNTMPTYQAGKIIGKGGSGS